MKICKHNDGLGRCGISGEYCVEGPCHCEELIEYEPVRHGHWVRKGQDIYCSECGGESKYTWHGISSFSDYCPDCGAKMDLEG